MTIENDKIIVSFAPGTKLTNALSETINFCKNHNVEVELTFNGQMNTITKFTKASRAYRNWF